MPQNFLPGETGGIPNVLMNRLRRNPLQQFLERLQVPNLGTRDPVGFPDAEPETFPEPPVNPFRKEPPQALDLPIRRELPENYTGLKAAGVVADDQLPLRRMATIPQSPSLRRELETPFPPPTRADEIRSAIAGLNPPRPATFKGKLAQSLMAAAPTALGAIFGGEAGASGAAEGTLELQGQQQQQRELRRKSLGEALENERQREARAAEFQAQKEERANTLAENLRQFEIEQQGQAATRAEQMRHNQALEAPKPVTPEDFTLSQGQTRFDPTGKIRASVAAAPPKPPDLSFEEATFEDFKKDPTLTQKYGATRLGFDLYKQDQAIQRSIASRTPAAPKPSRPVLASDAGKVSEWNNSLKDVAVLKSVISATGDTGTLARIQANAPKWVTDLTGGWGAAAKSRLAVINRVKQVIGKALEGGVLRKEDEEKYKDILPTIDDVKSVVDSKLAGLDLAIRQHRDTHLDALDDAGFDVSRFRARVAGELPKAEGEGGGAITVKPGGAVDRLLGGR